MAFAYKKSKKRVCYFCKDNTNYIDYKHPESLRRYISEKGKILPRRVTGCCAKHQRKLSNAIKRARAIALLPFTTSRI